MDEFWYDNKCYPDPKPKDSNKLHRDCGPAVSVDNDVYLYWYKHGKQHNDSGPAAIVGGSKYWFADNKRHRIDGPAVETRDHKEWWVKGWQINEKDFHAIKGANRKTLANYLLSPNGGERYLAECRIKQLGEKDDR